MIVILFEIMAQLKTENRLKTFGENAWSFSKAAVLPAIAYLGLKSLGVNFELSDINAGLQNIAETAQHEGPFIAGFATGMVQNAILIGSTLKNLNGKTEAGNYQPIRQDSDGTFVFQLACVDKRRADKSGTALPGSFGPMGAEFIGLAAAMMTQGIAPNTVLGDFATGYFLGSNILTEAYSHLALLGEIGKLATNSSYKGHRLKIEMMDHWDGCGAEGFTNPLTYLLKFKGHKLTLADLTALPNEVAGYIYVNGFLGPAIGILSGGRISLSAVLKHSEMVKTGH